MRIIDILTENRCIPLKTQFKTALRATNSLNIVEVKVKTDQLEGVGEATPVFEITGETDSSVSGAVNRIKTALVGMDVDDFEDIMCIINRFPGNPCAKAALDMAMYDIASKKVKQPLYKFLGGTYSELTTDITISANTFDLMMEDCHRRVGEGFTHLKIKVGTNAEKDTETLLEIANSFSKTMLRIDANQGWTAKEAVKVMRKLEDSTDNLELLEQPVKAEDIIGMKYVADRISTPVMADESVFLPKDVMKIIEMRAADIINIKLMKAGGIYNALKICSMAEEGGLECMMGCMLEGIRGVSAAAHLAMARKIITKIDLDAVLLCAGDDAGTYTGDRSKIRLAEGYGISLVGGAL